MKHKLGTLLLCLSIGYVAHAQTGKNMGIGVAIPDPNAILHMESENQGILIPNVILQDIHQKFAVDSEMKESLLVYNKRESEEVAKGYYYWTVTGTEPNGKWVRVLTSEDHDRLVAEQIQESFVEETILVNGEPEGTGVFIYTPDKTMAEDPQAPGRLVLDIPDLVVKNQTLTSFTLEQFALYHYSNGDVTRIPKTVEETNNGMIRLEKTTTELELVYTDEEEKVFNFAVKDLLGGNNDDIPAITNLKVNQVSTGLVFTNEKGIDILVDLAELVKKNETVTTMTIDEHDNLVFVNERQAIQQVNIRNVVKEPWHKAEDNTEAISIADNIFTHGWVGIGLSPEQAKEAIHHLKPDEKLRINGSIYARNSYYADYVFDTYFSNEVSDLKEDYRFKDLTTVESFIKTNHHLPGITPITALEQSTEEGYLINVSELSIQLLEKVEELYLHTIEQQKIIEKQQEALDRLQQQFSEFEQRMKVQQ
jgi:hypothetical protein